MRCPGCKDGILVQGRDSEGEYFSCDECETEWAPEEVGE